MTDDQIDDSDRPEHDAVRRLLAQARHTDPMPADVAARMDAVLAELRREPAAAEPVATRTPRDLAPITPLPSHRRRNAATLLLAAAAIVVGGVVVAPHLPSAGDQHASATAGSAEGTARSSASAFANAPERGPGPASPAPSALRSAHGLPVIRPGHFSADAYAAKVDSAYQEQDRVAGVDCVPASSGGRVVPVSYERAPAALLFHRAHGSTQVVDLFLCGRSAPTRSVTLALP